MIENHRVGTMPSRIVRRECEEKCCKREETVIQRKRIQDFEGHFRESPGFLRQ